MNLKDKIFSYSPFVPWIFFFSMFPETRYFLRPYYAGCKVHRELTYIVVHCHLFLTLSIVDGQGRWGVNHCTFSITEDHRFKPGYCSNSLSKKLTSSYNRTKVQMNDKMVTFPSISMNIIRVGWPDLIFFTAQAAEADGIPVFKYKRWQLKKVAIPEVVEEYKSTGAELNVLPFCSQFIPMDVITFPKHQSIIYHPSILPRHRGASAINW